MERCKKCHNEIPPYSDYCLHCGTKVKVSKDRTVPVKYLFVIILVLFVLLVSVLCTFIGPSPDVSDVADNITQNVTEAPSTVEASIASESIPVETIELIPEAEPASGRLFDAARPSTAEMCTITIHAPEGNGNLFVFEIVSIYRKNISFATENKDSSSPQYSALPVDSSVVKLYVRAGETASITLPRSICNIYLAKGDKWYGKDHLFGENTKYYLVCSNHEITTEDLQGTSLTLGNWGVGMFGSQPIGLDEITADEFPA